jgi:hypothetical protein
MAHYLNKMEKIYFMVQILLQDLKFKIHHVYI